MEASILKTIRKKVVGSEENTFFDMDLIDFANSAFLALNQIGVGPSQVFMITDDKPEWADFIQDINLIETVRAYVPLRVRLDFDPPTNMSARDALRETLNQLEWRLQHAVEYQMGGYNYG